MAARAVSAPSHEFVVTADRLTRNYSIKRGLFRGDATLRAVDGVSFALRAGRTLAVVGESGSGKSTLARVVALIEPPTSGTLALMGENPFAADRGGRRALRRAVQMVFQDPYGSLNPRRKVGAILEEPLEVKAGHARIPERPGTGMRWDERAVKRFAL